MPKKKFKKKLKQQIIHDTAFDELEESIDLKWYSKIAPIIEAFRRDSLEKIKEENHTYKPQELPNINPEFQDKEIDPIAQDTYIKWKADNPVDISEYPEVSLTKLLITIQRIKVEIDKNNQQNEGENDDFDIKQCAKNCNSNKTIYSDSVSNILAALRECLFTRNWEMMIRFLIMLLKSPAPHNYLVLIKTYCQILLKRYPLITQCGLSDQFRILQGTSEDSEIDVV